MNDQSDLPEFDGGYRNDLSEAEHELLDQVWDELDAEWRAEEEAAAKNQAAGNQSSPNSSRATDTQTS
ncbi:MAG: hypothetical protein ACK5Q5_22490 [Planctomycetaceae bacterium]